MATYDKRSNNSRARFFVYHGKGVRPKRKEKHFQNKILAEIFEYKKDIEFYLDKKQTSPANLIDFEIDCWIRSFLKRRKVSSKIGRANLTLILTNHLKTGKKTSVDILDALDNHVNILKLRNAADTTIKNYSGHIKKITAALNSLDIKYHHSLTPDFSLQLKEIFPEVSNRTIDPK